jgi:hypothetical protein
MTASKEASQTSASSHRLDLLKKKKMNEKEIY